MPQPTALRTDRSARRAFSRDAARKFARPGRNTATVPDVAALVHARHPLPYHAPSTATGRLRRDTKRNQRAEFWRTVKIRVSVELEPYFRRSLHLLGKGARIDGGHKVVNWCAWDLAVHVPGAPAAAVRAEPVYYSDWNGEHHVPRIDHVQWYDADGQRIEQLATA